MDARSSLDDSRRQDAVQAWKDHTDRQAFEHQLIDRKTSWALTTHGIMFAAYGVALQGGEEVTQQFRSTVAWTGLSVAAITLVGVVFVVASKWRAFMLYKHYFEKIEKVRNRPDLPGISPLKWGSGLFNTAGTLLPDFCLPLAFIVAWAVLVRG